MNMRRIKQSLAGVGAALVAAVSVAGVAGVPASASSCVSTNVASYFAASGYQYTRNLSVPYNSACHDINITYISGGNHCATMRVRFYPSSGGNYANSWKYVCTTGSYRVIASDVMNGTNFRVETQGSNIYYFTVTD